MKKGDLVTFIKDSHNATRSYRRGTNVYYASRPITADECAEWYGSESSKGIDSAGESKLPPTSVNVELNRSGCYLVEKARCRVRLGWGNPTPGMTKIKCLKTGRIAFVDRTHLQVLA